MSVPKLGIYEPANKSFKIQITSANPSNGEIKGSYSTAFTPEGVLSQGGSVGQYRWVKNEAGVDGVAPFWISFQAFFRPSGRPYGLGDQWNGVYRKDNTMLLTGTRGYVNNKGEIESICLGTMVFELI